jgi:hypothetical protein
MKALRRGVVAVAAVGLTLSGGAAAFKASTPKQPSQNSATCIAIEGSFDYAEKQAVASAKKTGNWSLVHLLENREDAALAANHCALVN